MNDISPIAALLAVGQMLFNIALIVFGVWLKRHVSRMDTLEDQVTKQAKQLVDQRMNSGLQSMANQVEGLRGEVHRINDRLEKGDNQLAHLTTEDLKQESRVLQELKSMQQWMNEHFATRDEIRELAKRLHEVETQR